MKKLLCYFVVMSVIIIGCDSSNTVDPNNPEISQTEALKIVEEHYLNDDYAVFVSETIISKKTEIVCSKPISSPNYDSWLVFIDEHPQLNWEHPCKLIFVNANTGNFSVIEEKFPPNLPNLVLIKQKELKTQITEADYIKIPKKQNLKTSSSWSPWAIIISGGGNRNSNYERYWNDCSAIFQTLKNVYGYSQSNIKVIMSDGTNPAADRYRINGTFDSSPLDLDGDGVNDVQYAATKSNVKNVISETFKAMDVYDRLFIFVTDHGGRDSNGSFIYLWNNEIITAQELSDVLRIHNGSRGRGAPPQKTVHGVMGQCYSGGFVSCFTMGGLRQFSASAACREDELSWATPNLLYDEYLLHWISAMAGINFENNSEGNADTDNSGYVSFEEAFIYARDNDRRNETPQYLTHRGYGSYTGLNNM